MKKFLLATAIATASLLNASGQTILIDFGNNATFRGVSSPGNWNSVGYGYVANLIDSNGSATSLDWAPDGLGNTDSFNSLVGATSNPVTAGEISLADAALNKTSLGALGVAQAAIDYLKSDNFTTNVGRFQIQQLTPGQLYNLTFYGTKQFVASGNEQTKYSVFDDSSYSSLLGSGVLTTGTTNNAGNPSSTVTIPNLTGPSNANNIFYVQWEGVNNSSEGFINSLAIVAVPEPSTWAMLGIGAVGVVLAGRRRCQRES